MKRLIALFALACLLLHAAPAAQAAGLPGIEDKDIDTFMGEYMQANGLDETNFAMGWHNTVTGESWYFGEDDYRVAGSMYKLPLVMAILDLVAEGTLPANELVGGYDLDTAFKMTILYSSDEVAQALRQRISSDNITYRNALAAYSGFELSALPESFYSDNRMSPRFVIETLRTLYENETRYARLIELLKEAGEGRHFRRYQGEWDIAHKYGIYEGAFNDCAIVYTPEPFLLVVFLQDVPESERRLGELAALMTDYAVRQGEAHAQAAAEATPEPTPTPAAEPSAPPETAAPETAPPARSSEKTALLGLFALLAGLCLAAAILRFSRKKHLSAAVFLVLALAAAIAIFALLRFDAEGYAAQSHERTEITALQ